MPGNTEEKEQCLEKLNQMQKFLPFLDFMIDKIKRKKNKVSFECQLSKFQFLRSMIAERSGKYSWDVVIKVEDIIEKLISKLDFKDQHEKSNECAANADNQKCKTSTGSPEYIVPSSNTTTVTSASSSEMTTADLKPQDISMSSVDLIMRTLKVSVDSSSRKNTDRGKELLSNSVGPSQPVDVSGNTMETDLDKDLDGFDLTECPNFSESELSNSAVEPVSAAPGKAPSHDDLLSSSREKLLKSLQSRLLPCKPDSNSGKSPGSSRTEKGSETQSISAFSRSQSGSSERKNSDISEGSVHGGEKSSKKSVDVGGTGKQSGIPPKLGKPFVSSEKIRTDSGISSGDGSLKQRLKEKFSTDICEVYRVGKSVGGSLRSLKEPKDRRKSYTPDEEELFKPDKIAEKNVGSRSSGSQSKSSGERKDKKSHHDSSTRSEKKEEKTDKNISHKWDSGKKDDNLKKCEIKAPKSDKAQEGRSSKEEKKPESHKKKEKEENNFELSKLNDEELLEFVKENIQFLPHLAKLKPGELRKAVQSGLGSLAGLEADSVSEISDDSFHDWDVEIISGSKASPKKSAYMPVTVKEPHPLAAVKIAQVGSDGVAKNVKPIVESKMDTKSLDEVGDKTHDMDDLSSEENLDEEDYAQKLIEETTPRAPPPSEPKKKKKGLLELPMPMVDDLFDDISSLESFESCKTPPHNPDPRLRGKNPLGKKKPEVSQQPNTESNAVASPVRPGPNGPSNPPKDLNQSCRPQTTFGSPQESYKAQRSIQNRPDPWPSKPLPGLGLGSQEVNQHPQPSTRFTNESSDSTRRNPGTCTKPQVNPTYNRRHSYGSSEPKSYAEYKRMKQKEKLNQQEAENAKSNTPDSSVTEISKSPAERDDGEKTTVKKPVDPRLRSKESFPKQSNSKSYQSSSTYDDRRRSVHVGQRRYSDHVDNRSREERKGHDESGKESGRVGDEKRHSVESEELVSPLEELYREERKPKTGRGYGIQHFKIPKKSREPVHSNPKPSDGQALASHSAAATEEGKTPAVNIQNEADAAKESSKADAAKGSSKADSAKESSKQDAAKESSKAEEIQTGGNSVEAKKSSEKSERSASNSAVSKDIPSKSVKKVESSKTCKTDSSITEVEVCDSNVSKSVVDSTKPTSLSTVESEGVLSEEKTEKDIVTKGEEERKEKRVEKTVTETVRTCEPQVAECDSSMECSGIIEQNGGSESVPDKITPKDDSKFTQEFVEALIRKSFQSGEGKLLLAHAKLFEEFARKLNSKKLKTIQRIINSETDSSSSSAEVSSEDEKKKKKSKKSEEKSQRGRKAKKRGKKSKRYKSTSPSSSSWESEGTSDEEYCEKKGEKSVGKHTEGSSTGEGKPEGDTESRDEDSPPVKSSTKSKKRRRNPEFGKDFSGRKAKRRQEQKKLLEKIMNETPAQESNVSNTGTKTRRAKGKVKTELDRLHEDIKNMFMIDGVVTPTGQRMCRILRQSGGSINNMDIVKESAKMVEEEKLKKVHTRSASKNPRGGNPDSKYLEYYLQNEDVTDWKLRSEPQVVLPQVDLNKFGYGVKISEDCISFRRLRGLNMAIRSAVPEKGKQLDRGLAKNVFLARNKRKVERLRDSKRRKGYFGKRLMDVVKNLPLKMAKMKHLQICEANPEDESDKKRPYSSRKSPKRGIARKKNFSNAELINYAFERIRVMYSCKLCSQVTRYITGHYKVAHPDHEVLISRLCVGEAKRARLDAKRNRYDSPPSDENPLAESMKRKMKILLHIPNSYNCRMCSAVKTKDLEVFKAHVSSHTGESRFECPGEGCNTRTYSQQDIRIHILTKHSKNKVEYSKVIELYKIVVEGGKMFGFLCSVCNFVQLCRSNVEEHISRQHTASDNATIIKINMSANVSKAVKNKFKNLLKEDAEKMTGGEEDSNGDKLEEESGEEEDVGENEEDVKKTQKRKKRRSRFESRPLEGESRAEEMEYNESVESKRVFLVDDEEEEEEEDDEEEDDEVPEGDENAKQEEVDVDVEDVGTEKEEPSDDIVTEECADVKEISSMSKGGEMLGSEEYSEKKENPSKGSKMSGGYCELKVGPLAAKLLGNSDVAYECYVKGCLFFTQAFDLFEKHIKITHCKTKWNGICEICTAGKDCMEWEEHSFKLLTALKHLRFHVRERSANVKLLKQNLVTQSKMGTSAAGHPANDKEENETDSKDSNEPLIQDEDPLSTKTDNAEAPFPVKPLLRVRNLLGDRLSTPKESLEENEVAEPTAAESSSMFTIENVRSLNDSPAEDSEIQIQDVCSLKDLPNTVPQLSSGKAILVRSCPTRKIALRPEASGLSIDVGQLSVVQAPSTTHSVVLTPIANAAPIRLIPSGVPNSSFTVKPILVSADPGRINTPNVLSLLSPALTPVVTSTIVSGEKNCIPQTENSSTSQIPTSSKPSLDVTVVPSNKSASTSKCASPNKAISSNKSAGKSTSPGVSSTIDVEEQEGKDTMQRMHTMSTIGNKRVKDAKIYEEMLTKTKLCHLFKCMGIECSFTCNSERVFRQHIGLHDAQSRLKKNKWMRTICIRLANKTTKAFYWQQCAYCCELLTKTNKALSQHVLEEHGHCMYQCAFCFYRAVSHSYVEIHQNLAHSHILKTTPRVIYKCKPLKKVPDQNTALEKHGRRQSVRPYHCDQCGHKFYITQHFVNHLTTQHQSVTAYTCHICKNLCFKADRLVVHYKMHSYCTYQCAYCLHGTDTEKEMVFHLCNFHFSQPAVMYVRAFAKGTNEDANEKLMTKKKFRSNQLESLKVIVYESDTLNTDCIVEVDCEEENPERGSEGSADLSSIVAELGINAEVQTSSCVTPLMKELASIGDQSAKNLTVKTLLPNAHFSSENENGGENCSVLISSGLSTPSDQSNDKAMNIPLGQLPLEVVNIQRNETTTPPSLPRNIASPDRNLKLNEIIVNLQNKDKVVAIPSDEEDKQSNVASAIHKLPPVVICRSTAKNVYPSKRTSLNKRPEESSQETDSCGVESTTQKRSQSESNEAEGGSSGEKTRSTNSGDSVEDGSTPCENSSEVDENTSNLSTEQPLISNVVSLSQESSSEENTLVISDICSLSEKESSNSGVVINVHSKVRCPSVLKPPIIRVEDFPVGEKSGEVPTVENSERKEVKNDADEEPEKPEVERSSSPDVIILEEDKSKNIITVTLDSDEEKDENRKETVNGESNTSETRPKPPGGDKIRKEMELLRNQIASETDSLLFDEPEGEKSKDGDLSLSIDPNSEESAPQSLLSPIEEAICSLNKKLQSESEQASKKDQKKGDETPEKSDANEVPERRRTRFANRDRRREVEVAEKSDGDEVRKDDTGKCKKEELVGKELYICGNENCNFAADDDSALKDHLYVCDLSRETSVLVCPHCSKQTKQFYFYLEHLKYHGQKKFHCGLCEFSSAVDASVSRHVKQKHKCSLVKTLPKDSQPGHVVYYPKNHKVDKIDFEVNGYSPGDEDKLPLQSVYQVNVKCAKCPYFTKVRSNMVRHLKIHLKSVETEGVVVVPSTAPTNPVPCLETKERMFDKMTNLAASSQLAQAKEKTAIESLSPEDEAKLPQFVTEQLRYKCCLPDCNYITVDEGMLKHHIKALHDEINYYSCPHCQDTVHVDVRHVTLDKIGHHLKHHDTKLYKCGHCIYFHYQKNVVEKHTMEKHPDRRYFVHTVREPKPEAPTDTDGSPDDGGPRVWKCGLCESFHSPSKPALMEHLLKNHNIKSKYRCKLCTMKGNNYQAFINHFASKHPGEKVSYVKVYQSERVPSGSLESGNSSGADSSSEHFDTTPLWQRGTPRIRHIRGILIEEEEIKTKKSKRSSLDESEVETGENATVKNAFSCPLCTNKKKPFYTRNEDCFRTHLYQELNYQQYACILCGKMFVDKKDFDRHHSRVHPGKEPAMKQTKEDHEIKYWVDQVIAKRLQEMEERKRKLGEEEASSSQVPAKRKKEG